MPKAEINHLQYWDEPLLKSQLSTTKAHRYITFDIDQGGLNNIRLVFEYVVVVAAITGRTLVLPPSSPWYLMNFGPMPTEHIGGVSHLSDIYDIQALAQGIPVLSTEEFIDQARDHLSIPTNIQAPDDNDDDEQTLKEFAIVWREWLNKQGEIPGWNPYQTVIAHPSIKHAQSGPHFDEAYLDSRTPVEFSPKLNAAPALHFPSNDTHRSLGPVATMLACPDEVLPQLSRRLLKNHVRYRKEIFDLADTIIRRLGLSDGANSYLGKYDAMQIRRNDFQYEQTQLGVEAICQNVGVLFDQNQPIYIATDEDREEIFDQLAKHLKAKHVLSWKNVVDVLDEPVPYAWIGPLEQLICVPARRFVGTDLSTFSSYIHRVRGYLSAVDDNAYFHSESYTATDLPVTRAADYRGRDYLREHPLFWQSC